MLSGYSPPTGRGEGSLRRPGESLGHPQENPSRDSGKEAAIFASCDSLTLDLDEAAVLPVFVLRRILFHMSSGAVVSDP
jgi:hypothetical protein